MNDTAAPADVINYQREIARTQASMLVPAADGEPQQVLGNWSAGDLQATRSLAIVLANQLSLTNVELQRHEQQANIAAANANKAQAQLRDALRRLTDQQVTIAASVRAVETLRGIVRTKDQQIAEMLARVDSSTGDLLAELTQLRVEADGGRQLAVQQLTRDAFAQREQAVSDQYRMQDRLAQLEAENTRLTAENQKLQDEVHRLADAPGDDPWSDYDSVRVEWGTEHTLLDLSGDPASTPLVINVGTSRETAVERLEFWRQYLSERSRVRPVVRTWTTFGWSEAQL